MQQNPPKPPHPLFSLPIELIARIFAQGIFFGDNVYQMSILEGVELVSKVFRNDYQRRTFIHQAMIWYHKRKQEVVSLPPISNGYTSLLDTLEAFGSESGPYSSENFARFNIEQRDICKIVTTKGRLMVLFYLRFVVCPPPEAYAHRTNCVICGKGRTCRFPHDCIYVPTVRGGKPMMRDFPIHEGCYYELPWELQAALCPTEHYTVTKVVRKHSINTVLPAPWRLPHVCLMQAGTLGHAIALIEKKVREYTNALDALKQKPVKSGFEDRRKDAVKRWEDRIKESRLSMIRRYWLDRSMGGDNVVVRVIIDEFGDLMHSVQMRSRRT